MRKKCHNLTHFTSYQMKESWLWCVRFLSKHPFLRKIFVEFREMKHECTWIAPKSSRQNDSIQMGKAIQYNVQAYTTAGTFVYHRWYFRVPLLVLPCTTAGTKPFVPFLSVPHKHNPCISPCSSVKADQKSHAKHSIIRKILRNVSRRYTMINIHFA